MPCSTGELNTRFTVSVGIDLSLTKTRRTRSADCICMDKRARISPLWEIVYYSDTCIVYLAVRETEYFTEILRNIPRMRERWCPGRFFPSPAKNGLGTRLACGIPGPMIPVVISRNWPPCVQWAWFKTTRAHKHGGLERAPRSKAAVLK